MDILIHSFLHKARQLNASLHIRYSARTRPSEAHIPAQGHDTPSGVTGGQGTMNSYVIIRREYSYLEPLVRSMFQDAEDVTVLIDRRSEDRSDTILLETGTEHEAALDRRSSKPMLDILINVPS
jgi:hypothetical protein